MGSMAFWYKKSETAGIAETTETSKGGKELSAVMNFNLWTQCKVGEKSFIDIGFLISNITAASKLYFYIPFTEDQISDLSNNITNSKSISAIFNEKYSVIDAYETNLFWPVRNTKGEVEFVVYSCPWIECLNKAMTPTQKENTGGMTFEIDVEKIAEQIRNISSSDFSIKDKLYFRFRVEIPEPKEKDTIVREYSPPNSFLQSTWATTYIVDFRFNDLRSLPDNIINEILTQKTAFVPITKLHFLLMTKAHVDVETGPRDFSLRELEENTWDGYIDKRFETKDIVAYHCADKQSVGREGEVIPICQWEFFAKVKVNNSTFKVVSTYLLVLLGITVFFNCMSSLVWGMITSNNLIGIIIVVGVYGFLLYLILTGKLSSVVDKLMRKE